ncbi:hypothetical protein AVEN_213487-1 [Araneus ventricosus]|uniref:Uncharacterized protein n=1 Tax=Araneus ventricosus TaxID=182803 RepID=A0A4Y2NP25_ARAVE|nr:hypothetical protein AVEN_213487-1 [Araneus ventricosus]
MEEPAILQQRQHLQLGATSVDLITEEISRKPSHFEILSVNFTYSSLSQNFAYHTECRSISDRREINKRKELQQALKRTPKESSEANWGCFLTIRSNAFKHQMMGRFFSDLKFFFDCFTNQCSRCSVD